MRGKHRRGRGIEEEIGCIGGREGRIEINRIMERIRGREKTMKGGRRLIIEEREKENKEKKMDI